MDDSRGLFVESIVGNEWVVFPAIAIAIFAIVYMQADSVLAWLYNKSLGQREVLIEYLDLMFVEIDRKKITITLLLLSFGLGALFFLLLWPHVVPGTIAAVVLTIVGWTVPKQIVIGLWEKRCKAVVNQMVDGLTIMANGIKAGLSVTQAMERVVENLGGPLGQEFGLILSQIRLGRSVEEAMTEFGDRIPQPEVQMLVTSIVILKETGGNLAETFETTVATIRDRQKVEKKIQAMTAQGIMQGVIITCIPFVLLGIFFMMDPNFVRPLFTRPLGIIFLMVVLALQIIGGVMIKKIVTIKV